MDKEHLATALAFRAKTPAILLMNILGLLRAGLPFCSLTVHWTEQGRKTSTMSLLPRKPSSWDSILLDFNLR